MNKPIDKEFLERNLFEEAKVGCGYFPWTYYDKRYTVVIAPWTDGGSTYISISNEETKEEITFEKRKGLGRRVTEDDLKKCIGFINAPDEFEYTTEEQN